MRRSMVLIPVCAMVMSSVATSWQRTSAQTVTGPITDSRQLRLPASAFPADYKEDGNEAWPISYADGSTFSKLHTRSYSALGLRGAWYQYYSKIIIKKFDASDIILISPVEVAYLGTFYADATAAEVAYTDIQSNFVLRHPVPCSYGTHCMTYDVELLWNEIPYAGLVRIIQQGNAVAEIRSSVIRDLRDYVGTDTFNANLDRVSQSFVETMSNAVPTSTPIPPTTVPTRTATPAPTTVPTNTPTPSPTSSPTATSTPTTIPVSFDILSVRAEKRGSKPDTHLQRSPLTKVKVGSRFFLSIYVDVRSAPAGASGSNQFQLSRGGQTVFRRTTQVPVTSPGESIYRSTATYNAKQPGRYVFRGMVTINGHMQQRSTSIRIVR